MREHRRATRTLLIGPATDDPLAPFVAAVDALAATAPSRVLDRRQDRQAASVSD